MKPFLRNFSGSAMLALLALFTVLGIVGCGGSQRGVGDLAPEERVLVVKSRGETPQTEEWGSLLGLDEYGQSDSGAGNLVNEKIKKPGRNFPKWAGSKLEAPASAAYPDGANSPVQAMMLARHTARDKALRNLADIVLTLSSPQGGAVSDLLKKNPDPIDELDRLIREKVIFEEDKAVEERYVVLATLPLYDVALLLFGEEVQDRKTPGSNAQSARGIQLSQEDSRRIAYDNALKSARETMIDRLKQIPVEENGPTIGRLLEKNPEAAPMLRTVVDNAQVSQVEYPDDQTCELSLSLNLPPVKRYFQRHFAE